MFSFDGLQVQANRVTRRRGVALALAALAAFVACMLLPQAGFGASLAKQWSPQVDQRIPGLPQQAGYAGSSAKQLLRRADQSARIPGHYIVVFKHGAVTNPTVAAKRQIGDLGGKLGHVYSLSIHGYSASGLTKHDVAALRADPRVKYVEPDSRVKAFAQEIPKGINRVFAPQNSALDIDETDDARINADVAVIDTGIDYTHPDLNVVSRTDCSSGECKNGQAVDETGHGTHVAGTVGAIDNSYGVVGVAPGVRLWAVKVLNSKGEGTTAAVIAGIEWVTAHASEIEVANMSLGGPGESKAMNEAIAASIAKGVVYVVAAGNEGVNAANVHPANDPEVITVSALSDWDGKPGGSEHENVPCKPWYGLGGDDMLANFSNWGSVVDIAAPGVCIRSTWTNGEYEYDSGTSMAAPHVAGAAAYLASKSNPNSTADVEAIRNQLVNEGSLNWSDTSSDNVQEPVLYVGGTPLSTEVTTGKASNVHDGEATLTGTLEAHGQKAEYSFEWGRTTEYGKATSKASTSGYVSASTTIKSLKPGVTYHFRLVATAGGTTVKGADTTFTVSRWVRQPLLGGPEGATEDWLEDVSCWAPGECKAVSQASKGGGVGVYTLSGGSWTYSTVSSGSEQIHSISCTAANACTVVGEKISSEIHLPWASRWNGTSWTAETVSLPKETTSARLLGVSCDSATHCMAVGNSNHSGEIYAAEWKEGKWTSQPPAREQEPYTWEARLRDVSCTSSTNCVAVGWYIGLSELSQFVGKPLVYAWNGTIWSAQTPAMSEGVFESIDCRSNNYCTAVGDEVRFTGIYEEATVFVWEVQPDVEVWNGSKWSDGGAVAPKHGEEVVSDLTSISCVSTSDCIAVGKTGKGEEIEEEETYSVLAERWNGSSWSIDATYNSAEAVTDERAGVSCTRASCASVGFSSEGTSKEFVLDQRESLLTEGASEVTPVSATLEGTLEPQGLETTYYFEYGYGTSYGSKTSTTSAGSGNDIVEASQGISGLVANTTYHYRLVAENSSGKYVGADKTFTTAARPTPVTGSVLCNASEELCKEANRYTAGQKLQASLKTGTTLTIVSGGTSLASCSSSTLEGEVTGSGGNGKAATAKISAASFSSCNTTLSAEGLNWTSEIQRPGTLGEGEQTISGMKLSVKYAGITCVYGASPTVPMKGGSAAELAFAEYPLTKQSGGFACPESATLNATYAYSSPAPLYVRAPVALGSTVLCKTSEEPCLQANRYAFGTALKASLKSATTLSIETSGGTVTCSTSTLEGKVTAAGGPKEVVKADVSTASFGSCSTPVTAEGLAWSSEISRTEGLSTGTRTFTGLKLSTKIAGVTCVYGGTVTFSLKGGSQAEMVATGASMTKQSGSFLCPSTATLTATYVFSAPAPLYVGWPG